MKALGLIQYKHAPCKHKVSGADRRRGYRPWWQVQFRQSNKSKHRQIEKLECRKITKEWERS